MSIHPDMKKIAIIALIVLVVGLISVVGSAAYILNSNYFETGMLQEQQDQYLDFGADMEQQVGSAISVFGTLQMTPDFVEVLTTTHASDADVNTLMNSIDYDSILMDSQQANAYSNTTFYTTNPTITFRSNFMLITEDIEQQEWYDTILLVRRPISFDIINGEPYILFRLDEFDNPEGYITIGLTSFDLDSLERLDPDSTRVFITNATQERTLEIYGARDLSKPLSMYSQIYESEYLDDEMILVYTILQGTQITSWRLTIITDPVVFVNEFIRYASLAFVAMLVVVFLVFFRVSYIKEINQSVDDLTMDDIQDIMASQKPSRIQKMIKNLYDKVETLIQENQELDIMNQRKETEKREAEIKALLSQISPHYIFNLLDAIHKRAVINNETESAKMILLMSRQLRRSLEWNEPLVSIHDELAHIKSYIDLQQFYYATEFDFQFDIDDNLGDFMVPKLIFQTLIENALKHGVQDLPFYMQVKQFEGFLHFSITNGVDGHPKDIEQKIMSVIESSTDNENYDGIGLENMAKRLAFYYEDDYKVITQKYKQNISITIVIKIKH